MRGFWGRLLIAIEPLAIAFFFVGIAVALLVRHQDGAPFIAPIFGVAALLFVTYAVALMWSVTRALIATFGTISVVDGYVRYRAESLEGETTYYVAVLDEQRVILGEWPLASRPAGIERGQPWPALVEFSRHAGIHRIDGQSTGVLPDDIPPLGIGAPAAYARTTKR